MLCSLQFPAFVRVVISAICRKRAIGSDGAFPVASFPICCARSRPVWTAWTTTA